MLGFSPAHLVVWYVRETIYASVWYVRDTIYASLLGRIYRQSQSSSIYVMCHVSYMSYVMSHVSCVSYMSSKAKAALQSSSPTKTPLYMSWVMCHVFPICPRKPKQLSNQNSSQTKEVRIYRVSHQNSSQTKEARIYRVSNKSSSPTKSSLHGLRGVLVGELLWLSRTYRKHMRHDSWHMTYRRHDSWHI
jgi:hypothetical protein